jgi:hypothetical protein
MYRLIVILEWIFGAAFVFLFFALFVFHQRLFPGDALLLIGVAVILTLLFVLGAGAADDHVKISAEDRANARKVKGDSPRLGGRSYGRDLIFIGATFGIIGAFSIISGQKTFCHDSLRSYCRLLRGVAAPLGIPDTDTAIALVLVLIGAFFGLWGFWINHSSHSTSARRMDRS